MPWIHWLQDLPARQGCGPVIPPWSNRGALVLQNGSRIIEFRGQIPGFQLPVPCRRIAISPCDSSALLSYSQFASRSHSLGRKVRRSPWDRNQFPPDDAPPVGEQRCRWTTTRNVQATGVSPVPLTGRKVRETMPFTSPPARAPSVGSSVVVWPAGRRSSC